VVEAEEEEEEEEEEEGVAVVAGQPFPSPSPSPSLSASSTPRQPYTPQAARYTHPSLCDVSDTRDVGAKAYAQ